MERKPLYHVAPRSAREAILHEGLTIGNAPQFAYIGPDGHPDGVLHLWTDFILAARWMLRYTHLTDLWVVETDGLMISTPGSCPLSTDPGAYTPNPVSPERLRRIPLSA
jgi:hypothetical protein